MYYQSESLWIQCLWINCFWINFSNYQLYTIAIKLKWSPSMSLNWFLRNISSSNWIYFSQWFTLLRVSSFDWIKIFEANETVNRQKNVLTEMSWFEYNNAQRKKELNQLALVNYSKSKIYDIQVKERFSQSILLRLNLMFSSVRIDNDFIWGKYNELLRKIIHFRIRKRLKSHLIYDFYFQK